MSAPSFLRRSRGAAAVEMSICMLVIVPVFLYALFLDDLLRHSLDAQEAALSTPWDFAVQDYSRGMLRVDGHYTPGEVTTVQRQARLMFCDHESGIDSYTQGTYTDDQGKSYSKYRDCEETNHHQALAAHVCWINDNAKQVTCTEADGDAVKLGDDLHSYFQDKFSHGGLIRCSARAVVENYLLPKSFFQQFAKEELSKHKWKGTGKQIHVNAGEGDGTNAYFLAEQRLAILADTWALTTPANVRPDERYPSAPEGQKSPRKAPERDLHSELRYLYQYEKGSYRDLESQTEEFFDLAEDGEVLSPSVMAQEDPREPRLAISPVHGGAPVEKIQQTSGSTTYFNTQWRDWDKNYTQLTYERRGAGYLGCKLGEGC